MERSSASPLANNLLHSPHRMSLIPFSLQVALALLRPCHPWSPDHGQGAAGASRWTGVASPGQWDGSTRPACSAFHLPEFIPFYFFFSPG